MAQRTRDGRTQVDRDGIREHIGAAASTINHWQRHHATAFPPPAGTDPDGRQWWWLEDITAFHNRHLASRIAAFTAIDRTGDPDELVTAPQAAQILGYRDHRSLTAALIKNPDDVTELPGGRVRRRWYRRTIWAYADNRAHHRSPGPPPGTPSRRRKTYPYADDDRLGTVRQLLDTGHGPAAIAAHFGVSRRTAERLINALATGRKASNSALDS